MYKENETDAVLVRTRTFHRNRIPFKIQTNHNIKNNKFTCTGNVSRKCQALLNTFQYLQNKDFPVTFIYIIERIIP